MFGYATVPPIDSLWERNNRFLLLEIQFFKADCNETVRVRPKPLHSLDRISRPNCTQCMLYDELNILYMWILGYKAQDEKES